MKSVRYGKPLSDELSRIEEELKAEVKRVRELKKQIGRLVEQYKKAEDADDGDAWDKAKIAYTTLINETETDILGLPDSLYSAVRAWSDDD